MAKHRAVIVGAGRIGAGFNWEDDAYTHAGAYRALKDRVELIGFIEPDYNRRTHAGLKWKVPTYESLPIGLEALKPDVVSICTQPEQQAEMIGRVLPFSIKSIWCEKPFVSAKAWIPIQVNYLRRADHLHQWIAKEKTGGTLKVWGKDDIHTRCHFEDLAKWWKATLQYFPQSGPCKYYYEYEEDVYAFPNGGLEKPGDQMKAMLENLLNHIDTGEPLWSPPT